MREDVKAYYGKILKSTGDLKTSACCTTADTPGNLNALLTNIHPEVLDRYYGCGIIIPEQLKGKKILDLGCGAGRDVYVLSQLVGEEGKVVGVDMTREQLAVAEKHQDFHREKCGFQSSNVEFKQGYIEKLDELGLEDNWFDVIISNCVINLSPQKEAVFKEAYRVLKPGGEVYFSDVYADRRVPGELLDDPVLEGECLSGALYRKDFIQLVQSLGFNDPRLVEEKPIGIHQPEIKQKIGHIQFSSATYRLFKLSNLEKGREDYGQTIIYKGSLPECPDVYRMDKETIFRAGEPTPVCRNTFNILFASRMAEHFEFIGEGRAHLGEFQRREENQYDTYSSTLNIDRNFPKSIQITQNDDSSGCCGGSGQNSSCGCS